MNRQNRIDQTSLRNGLERFTKKCDLEKLIVIPTTIVAIDEYIRS